MLPAVFFFTCCHLQICLFAVLCQMPCSQENVPIVNKLDCTKDFIYWLYFPLHSLLALQIPQNRVFPQLFEIEFACSGHKWIRISGKSDRLKPQAGHGLRGGRAIGARVPLMGWKQSRPGRQILLARLSGRYELLVKGIHCCWQLTPEW